MLNELLLPLREYFGFLNLFEYITFRAGASAILALLISFIFGPFVVKKLINLLNKNGFLFYETFSLGNEKYGSPKNPNFLLKDKELLDIFGQELLPLSFYDGKLNNGTIAVKQRASFKKRRLINKTPE